MIKKLISYLIILSMLMMDAAPAMEEWSRDDDSHREKKARMTPSLHVLARGEREKEDAEHSDDEGDEGSRSSSFNSNEFGRSWRVLPEDHKRMLKNMASLRRQGDYYLLQRRNSLKA